MDYVAYLVSLCMGFIVQGIDKTIRMFLINSHNNGFYILIENIFLSTKPVSKLSHRA